MVALYDRMTSLSPVKVFGAADCSQAIRISQLGEDTDLIVVFELYTYSHGNDYTFTSIFDKSKFHKRTCA